MGEELSFLLRDTFRERRRNGEASPGHRLEKKAEEPGESVAREKVALSFSRRFEHHVVRVDFLEYLQGHFLTRLSLAHVLVLDLQRTHQLFEIG
jgi:hypothetical protein